MSQLRQVDVSPPVGSSKGSNQRFNRLSPRQKNTVAATAARGRMPDRGSSNVSNQRFETILSHAYKFFNQNLLLLQIFNYYDMILSNEAKGELSDERF